MILRLRQKGGDKEGIRMAREDTSTTTSEDKFRRVGEDISEKTSPQ